MAEWIISSSVLITVVAALRFILRGKISLRLQYALWALVLIRLLIPVSFGASSVSVMNAVPGVLPETALSTDIPAEAYTPLVEGILPEISSPVTPKNIDVGTNVESYATVVSDHVPDWSFVALVIWLIGLAILGLFLLITNLRFSIRLRNDRCMTDIYGYSLPVYTSGMLETPCLYGLFHPAIYVTQEVKEDEQTLRHVLEHEATHYRHRDHIWAILRGVCLLLHWYNPLVWIAASLSMRDAELACDEGTIKRIGEESRGDYGRSLVGLTCKKRSVHTFLITATTMTGSKKGIQERIILIAKKPKTALYTLVAVILVVVVAVGGTFTGAKGADTSSTYMEDAPSSTDFTDHSTSDGNAYTIPLDDVSFYGPHGIQQESTVDESDIAEILAEAESGGVKMLFYRAYSGDIWGAWMKDDGSVYRFLQAYDAQESWGYQSGFSIEPFQNLFGRDGFIMSLLLGASYRVYDYYFFNESGDIELLASCTNNHTVLDLNGDGSLELLYFSYINELRPYFYFQRDSGLYEVDVTALLYNTFLGWSHIQSEDSVSQDAEGPYLALTFRLGEEETEYSCRVRYTGNALVVEDIPESTFPANGEVWLIQQEDYEVGLRNQGDKVEILLRRDGAVMVLGSAPSDSDTRYSLRSFDAIPELSGFSLESLSGSGRICWYYAVQGNSAVCFAQSFGGDVIDVAADLNGDGQAELICNVTYNADGVTDALIYRMKDDLPQVASAKDAILNIPADKHLAHPASAVYDTNTGLVTLEYQIAGENDLHVETAPLNYDTLQFKDFTTIETQSKETDYSGYNELIAEARDVLENFDGNYPDEEPFSSVFYQRWDYETLGYLIKDIDGNGVDELIFGANTDGWDNGDWDGLIYDIYTLVNGNVFHVLDGWERNRYYFCENGYIANESSSSAFESTYSYYTYSGTELSMVESVLYYSRRDEEHPWFHTTEQEPDIKNAEPISESKAAEIKSKYLHEHPQYTPFIE
ncbi:M56 family metallopeptidase [Anaerocolumna sp. AGMB13020]|uniref:M56 family metallopeptidase n=1 Tax=Anaerocolumna sp. AGMB13020 TaxID=3081750 RepID=UPI002953B87F|nr:M56 family metallopeptidase [Anaerocolumna sp. AGMB13020]WOO35267.1 M56 family metallopeptidase [Anaerocolumna sp. AGMB13020]